MIFYFLETICSFLKYVIFLYTFSLSITLSLHYIITTTIFAHIPFSHLQFHALTMTLNVGIMVLMKFYIVHLIKPQLFKICSTLMNAGLRFCCDVTRTFYKVTSFLMLFSQKGDENTGHLYFIERLLPYRPALGCMSGKMGSCSEK